MTNFEEFVERAREDKVRIQVGEIQPPEEISSSEALFHLPLLALTMLIVTHGRKGLFTTSELSTWTAGVLTSYFDGLRASSRVLTWSPALRTRCADALVFLEDSGQVSVTGPNRRVEITPAGRDFLAGCASDQADVGVLVRGLRRAFERTRGTGLRLL
jgi:hypothetical protein